MTSGFQDSSRLDKHRSDKESQAFEPQPEASQEDPNFPEPTPNLLLSDNLEAVRNCDWIPRNVAQPSCGVVIAVTLWVTILHLDEETLKLRLV